MALQHAVLATLLDHEYSGYQLAKIFDIGVANFWHALPQQLYAELGKLEQAGLIRGRRVIQHDRPNKRVYTVTELGMAELERFTAAEAKPSFFRDDLLVKVYAADRTDAVTVMAQLTERAEQAKSKIALFDDILMRLRDGRDEQEFLRHGSRVGPYLTCLLGRSLEKEYHDWCLRCAELLGTREGVRDDA
ncbi:MAG: PadR family transcriptional regulator [Kutzneria sp.]|nr:PadR family transcriptional regulator [Kutzneria sp.]MBV9846675.1 PadR family transcriptional regulator [Kutzneria sp.]